MRSIGWVALALVTSCGGEPLGAVAGRVDIAEQWLWTPRVPGREPQVHAADVLLDDGLRGTLVIHNDGPTDARVRLDPASDTRVQLSASEAEVRAGKSLEVSLSLDATGIGPGAHRRELAIGWAQGSVTVGLLFRVPRPADAKVTVRALREGTEVARVAVPVRSADFLLELPGGEYELEASTEDAQARQTIRLGAGEQLRGVELELR
jgi:hypothetical protein